MRLLEITLAGEPAEPRDLPAEAVAVLPLTVALYKQFGFARPWIAYLAERDGQIVGTCAFKSPPQAGRIEIAYYTFPEHQGQGVATEMAGQLIALARAADPELKITAQTLPQPSASTAVLTKLGFSQARTIEHPEDGTVWEWEL